MTKCVGCGLRPVLEKITEIISCLRYYIAKKINNITKNNYQLMDNMIVHEITRKTEYKYGYISVRKADEEKFIKLFPKNNFIVNFEGIRVPNRKLDLARYRINLYPLRKHFQKGDVLIFKRNGNLIELTRERRIID
jgi:hypothetical protein